MADDAGPLATAADGHLTDDAFGADVAPYHRRIDVDDWADVYVVGDVHGCLDRLEALIDILGADEEDLLLFVGDLIRKGPEGRAVAERVRDAPNMLSVRGNNEDKVIRGRVDRPDLDPVRPYLEAMPVAVSFDDALVVHGGVDPRRSLDEHSVEDLLTFRSVPPENGYDGPFWFDAYEGPPRVFFGHTVLDEPVDREWAVGLDTGCVYGGRLTAYDYRRGSFTSVAGRTHQERPDRKFVATGAD